MAHLMDDGDKRRNRAAESNTRLETGQMVWSEQKSSKFVLYGRSFFWFLFVRVQPMNFGVISER